jgi:hypothetical protein
VNISNIAFSLRDNGGRRSGIDRRYFSYSDHIPERRTVDDRRSFSDRRSGLDRRNGNKKVINLDERRDITDRRRAWNEMILQFASI